LPAFIFHFMNGAGTLAQHFRQLFNARLADSSLAERRARLPWEVFADLLRRALRPRANRRRQPEAFWRGWRLLALDATQFSLTNTPQINRSVKKARSRRGKAAFAKLTVDVLLEVGLHNPLAAALGRQGQSEWELARGLLSQKEVAQSPGIPRTTLMYWERTGNLAGRKQILKLVGIYRVPVARLLRAESPLSE